ncbi:MAG: mannose-1-phosphate guanylyltransferase [Deltaproteobacteria bacterium]|nr:mannose-1-phosphate guanylyltransferase [Deltaproteobacteria bacterium]
MYCIIMCGGSGTRFWPASRRARPKQFLNITGRGPMVVETCDRLRPLALDREIVLVLGREHLEEARRLFTDREVHILAEPIGRNTAPCIGLGALYAAHLGSTEPLAFLPADHFIADEAAFLKALGRAAELARSGAIVTLGIVPTRPETGYGYIRRVGEQGAYPGGEAHEVAAFVEKPDLEKARQYVARGEYYWNAGIFVATAETILTEMETHLPDLYRGLLRLKHAIRSEAFEGEMEAVYRGLEAISFDYGIMERTTRPVLVVPCECGWSDVGSWESLYELKREGRDGSGNVSEGEALLQECRDSFVSARGGRLVACLGLRKCLIVDTPDALLVADLGRSQEIRKILGQMKKKRRDDLL